jgi:CheY-like chemotaxis protein
VNLVSRSQAVAPRPVPEAAVVTAAGDADDGPRILLAEDNAFNQKVAVSMLTMLGCRVEVACNGAEALDMLQRGEYDLVCMDCQMPEMDGYEATRRIRALPGGASRIPIVAMTANALNGDRQACLDAGMDDFLCKPINKVMLGEMLEKYGLVTTPA